MTDQLRKPEDVQDPDSKSSEAEALAAYVELVAKQAAQDIIDYALQANNFNPRPELRHRTTPAN